MTDFHRSPATEVLLPCPFCGGKMEEVTDEDGHYFVHPGRKGMDRADCWLCDAWVSDELTGEGSIGEWNTRAAPSRISAATESEVQDTYLVGGPPDLKAMSGSIDSDRVIQLHFRRKVTDRDREWLLAAINAYITAPAQPPMDREKIAKIFAYIWHGDLGEWRGFLSKADAFLAYPMTSTHHHTPEK